MKKLKLASFYSGCGGAAKGFLDAAEEYDLDCGSMTLKEIQRNADGKYCQSFIQNSMPKS